MSIGIMTLGSMVLMLVPVALALPVVATMLGLPAGLLRCTVMGLIGISVMSAVVMVVMPMSVVAVTAVTVVAMPVVAMAMIAVAMIMVLVAMAVVAMVVVGMVVVGMVVVGMPAATLAMRLPDGFATVPLTVSVLGGAWAGALHLVVPSDSGVGPSRPTTCHVGNFRAMVF